MSDDVAERIAAAVAAHGLATRRALPQGPLADADFAAVVARCQQHRLMGLLADSVGEGAFGASAAQIEQLAQWARAWSAVEVRCERLLLRAEAVLAADGIAFRAVKGAASAHRWYADPALRSFGDVDLLIEPAAFHRAGLLLADQLGMRRVLPEPRPGFDDEHGREILLRGGGLELDLHRTLIGGWYGTRLPLDRLQRGDDVVAIGGVGIPVLSPIDALVHAAMAAAIGDAPPRWSSRREVLQVVGAVAPSAEALAGAAAEWRCTALVALGLRESAAALGAELPPAIAAWTATVPLRPHEKALVAAYRSRRRGPAVQLTGLVAPMRGRSRRRLFVALARPSAEHRSARRAIATGSDPVA